MVSHSISHDTLYHHSYILGEDYEASGLRLVFAPDVTSLPVPIRILDDFLPEPLETFQLDLFTVVESPTLEIRGNKADVMITDNDGT